MVAAALLDQLLKVNLNHTDGSAEGLYAKAGIRETAVANGARRKTMMPARYIKRHAFTFTSRIPLDREHVIELLDLRWRLRSRQGRPKPAARAYSRSRRAAAGSGALGADVDPIERVIASLAVSRTESSVPIGPRARNRKR